MKTTHVWHCANERTLLSRISWVLFCFELCLYSFSSSSSSLTFLRFPILYLLFSSLLLWIFFPLISSIPFSFFFPFLFSSFSLFPVFYFSRVSFCFFFLLSYVLFTWTSSIWRRTAPKEKPFNNGNVCLTALPSKESTRAAPSLSSVSIAIGPAPLLTSWSLWEEMLSCSTSSWQNDKQNQKRKNEKSRQLTQQSNRTKEEETREKARGENRRNEQKKGGGEITKTAGKKEQERKKSSRTYALCKQQNKTKERKGGKK